ncbi:MAG: hypothetical protein ACXVFO_21450, partial [Solirubrobacteraceae bacterium]
SWPALLPVSAGPMLHAVPPVVLVAHAAAPWLVAARLVVPRLVLPRLVAARLLVVAPVRGRRVARGVDAQAVVRSPCGAARGAGAVADSGDPAAGAGRADQRRGLRPADRGRRGGRPRASRRAPASDRARPRGRGPAA